MRSVPFTMDEKIRDHIDHFARTEYMRLFRACILPIPLLYSNQAMSEYGHFITHKQSPPLISHDQVQEKKEARRKIIEQVEQRRAEAYRRYYKKRQLQADSEVL